MHLAISNKLKDKIEIKDENKFFFFTKSVVDEYVDRCIYACKKELERLKNDETLLEVLTYSW